MRVRVLVCVPVCDKWLSLSLRDPGKACLRPQGQNQHQRASSPGRIGGSSFPTSLPVRPLGLVLERLLASQSWQHRASLGTQLGAVAPGRVEDGSTGLGVRHTGVTVRLPHHVTLDSARSCLKFILASLKGVIVQKAEACCEGPMR